MFMRSARCRGSLSRISPSSSLAGFDGVSSLPFNLLVPSFQCIVSRCCRTRSSANRFVAMIEDFRLVSVLPHLQPFKPSPRDALCLSLNAHNESNDVMQRQFPGPQKPSSPAYITRQPGVHHHIQDERRQGKGPRRWSRVSYIARRTGFTDTLHTFSHSASHMAKMVRTPMKAAISAAPLRVSITTSLAAFESG
jgi:hypothetical protein